MGETANPGTDLTAEEAASTIAQARSYEEPLRRRTEGVTWMIWGLVPAGAQLTIDALPRYTGTYQGWMDTIPILAWVAVAVLLTYAVWRIAAFQRSVLDPRVRRTVAAALFWLPLVAAVVGASWWIAGTLAVGHDPVLFGVGVAWLVLGATDAFGTTGTGRRVLLAMGALVLLLTGVFLLAGGPGPSSLRLILVGGSVPFLAGLYQTLRG